VFPVGEGFARWSSRYSIGYGEKHLEKYHSGWLKRNQK